MYLSANWTFTRRSYWYRQLKVMLGTSVTALGVAMALWHKVPGRSWGTLNFSSTSIDCSWTEFWCSVQNLFLIQYFVSIGFFTNGLCYCFLLIGQFNDNSLNDHRIFLLCFCGALCQARWWLLVFCALRLFVDTCEVFIGTRYTELDTARSRKTFCEKHELPFGNLCFASLMSGSYMQFLEFR